MSFFQISMTVTSLALVAVLMILGISLQDTAIHMSDVDVRQELVQAEYLQK